MIDIKNKKKKHNKCKKELFLLLRGLKPSDYHHMTLFHGWCVSRPGNRHRLHHYTVQLTLENIFKMLDLNRHPLLHTTTRKSAPLGDPRGIPKLSKRFSQSKSYLRIGDRAITSVHRFKLEGSVNIAVASTGAKRIFFEVNIDIAKMSDFVGSDLSLFDGLLEQIGNSMEFTSDESIMPILSDIEQDFTSDFDMNMLNPSTPPQSLMTSDSNQLDHSSALTSQSQDHTIVIDIPSETELLWSQDVFYTLTAPSQPEVLLTIGSQEENRQDHQSCLSKIKDEREKNNQASREYRQRKKSKLAALQEEERELEAKNRQLRMKEAAMQNIVNRLKSKLVSVLANERPGL